MAKQVALPADNTDRWIVTYFNGVDNHHIQMRTPEGLTASQVASRFNDIFTAAAPLLPLTTINLFNHFAKESNVGLPQPLAGFAASYGTGTLTLVQSPQSLTFSGRGALGRKVHISLIGVKLGADNNYIISGTENTAVAAMITELRAGGASFWNSIDGAASSWYGGATYKTNDHFVKLRRGGS